MGDGGENRLRPFGRSRHDAKPMSLRVPIYLVGAKQSDYVALTRAGGSRPIALPVRSPYLCPMSPFNQLRRSRKRRIIAGVCGGVAEWLGWNVTLVRILFVVGSILPIIPGFVVYLVLWVILKEESVGTFN